MNYDVFLSCKSEDYKIAEVVYQYLTDNGFHYCPKKFSHKVN